MKRNCTLRDIAALTGCSMNTVSKALNNKGGVGKETMMRIRECARQQGYRPNMMARSMRGLDSNLIGVLLSDLSDEFFVSLLAGVEEEAAGQGMTVLVQNAGENVSKQIQGLKKLLSYGCQWIVVAPVEDFHEVLAVIRRENAHFVIADRVSLGMEDMDRVSINNRGDSRRVVEYLIGQGHRRIALVNRLSEVHTETERTAGYREALQAHGIAPRPEYELLCSNPEDARRKVGALMRSAERPTAMFIAIDKFAVGAVRALQEGGVRVPEDLELFIYGKMDWAPLFSAGVGEVQRNIREIGRASVRVLLDTRATASREPIEVLLDSQLILPGQAPREE